MHPILRQVSGIWLGEVRYGKQYGAHAHQLLLVEYTLDQDGNKVSGLCKDIEGVGMHPETATIQGRLEGNNLSFFKQYPSRHYYIDGETAIDPSEAGMEIHYKGKFDAQLMEFAGTWEIVRKKKIFWILSLAYSHGKGTWKMRKKE